jgi:hypothetical protein
VVPVVPVVPVVLELPTPPVPEEAEPEPDASVPVGAVLPEVTPALAPIDAVASVASVAAVLLEGVARVALLLETLTLERAAVPPVVAVLLEAEL